VDVEPYFDDDWIVYNDPDSNLNKRTDTKESYKEDNNVPNANKGGNVTDIPTV
jgi:hypothetical protein